MLGVSLLCEIVAAHRVLECKDPSIKISSAIPKSALLIANEISSCTIN